MTARPIDLKPVHRDRWDRPIIDGEPYHRASGAGKPLEDDSALVKWKMRLVAHGACADDTTVAETRMLTLDDKQALNRIAQDALERSQADAKARRGTVLHAATEKLDLDDLEGMNLTGETVEYLTAYENLLRAHRFDPLAVEVFVACRELKFAGTFDRLLQGPKRAIIGDLKSSAVTAPKYSSLSWGAQLAVYANAQPYCGERGWLTWDEVGLPEPDKSVGAILHVPADDPTAAAVWRVDLRQGYEMARLSRAVLDARKNTSILTEVPTP